MRLTHFGHASVLVETDDGRRVLFDPGTYATGFESLTGLDAIVVTHAHPDHLDAGRIGGLRDANPDAVLVATPEAMALADAPRENDRVVEDTQVLDVAGIRVQPTGRRHGTIHADLPEMGNRGFILDDKVWHPGDAFDADPRYVDVLLLPVGGPWMKIGEAVDFARAVSPRVIVPIHQGGLADVHRQLHYGLLKGLVSSAELVILDERIPHEI